MSVTTQVRLTGAGGQGLITAGVILAEAALLDGMFVVQTQSYGPEARLGSSKAEVIISDETIAYPQVTVPDILVCLSEEAAAKYSAEASSDTLIILDSTNVESTDPRSGKVVRFPITETAIKAGGKMAANVVALGVVNSYSKVVSPESLVKAIQQRVPQKFRDLNLSALQAAIGLAEEACNVV